MNKLKFGFSPCPNDTFILDALVNGKLDQDASVDFEWVIEDVETLNRMALEGSIDITKLSYGVYPKIINDYQILSSGSALGRACGPLLIYKNKPQDLKKAVVGIPGINTTAHFLMQKAFPELLLKKEMPFHAIEDQLLEGKIDLGLIIHENRFTYQAKGLHLLQDLGEYWEKETGFHIPLGGFAIKRTLSTEFKIEIERSIKKSVQFAFSNPLSSQNWIKRHAQEMDSEVINSHIKLYVNEFSIDLKQEGRNAIFHLLSESNISSTHSEKNFKKTSKIFLD